MKKVTVITLMGCLLVGVAILVFTAWARDDDAPPHDWSKLKIVPFTMGQIGFFDPDTGKLYIYETNGKCRGISQLTELGEPLKMMPSK
jgi:hypothetical protein